MSLEMTPFDRSHTNSYSSSVVTILCPCIVSFLPRDAMQARPMPSCGVCVRLSIYLSPSLSLSLSLSLCVCVSVTFVLSVKTNKDFFEIFSPSGSHTILVFTYQTGWRTGSYSAGMQVFDRPPSATRDNQ